MRVVSCTHIRLPTRFLYLIAGSTLTTKLAADFKSRANRGFRPRTLAAYKGKFRTFVAFLVVADIHQPDSFQAISTFVEYLAQQQLRAQTIGNYMAVLGHFFVVYGMNTEMLHNKLIKLAIRAVAYNAPLAFKIKGVFSIPQLKMLTNALKSFPHPEEITAICLMGFFGFYRLATLVPPNKSTFSPARYITHGDIIWGSPGVHVITKHAKNMQVSGHARVVQLPQLQDKEICPVAALKRIVSSNPDHKNLPVFTVFVAGATSILTAHKVRSILRQVVAKLGLPTMEYGLSCISTIRGDLGLRKQYRLAAY